MYNYPNSSSNTYQRQSDKSSPVGIIIFIVIIIVISALITVGFALYKAKKINLESESKDDVDQEIITAPLVLRATSNNTLISANYILKEEGQQVQTGKLSIGIPEVYPIAKEDYNYTLQAYGHSIYANSTICRMKDIDNCIVSVDKVAKVKMVGSRRSINVYVSEGLLRKPILCIAWSYTTVNVELKNMIETYAPKRLKDKVDVCYAITQKDMYALREKTIFDDMEWDLNTLKLKINDYVIDEYETNLSIEYSPIKEDAEITYRTSTVKLEIPEENKESINKSVLRFYDILVQNRDIRQDISIPLIAKSDEGQVRFILIDQGDSETLVPTYSEAEKYGMPDVQETFIYN